MNKIVVAVLSGILAVSVVANIVLVVMYDSSQQELKSEKIGSHAP